MMMESTNSSVTDTEILLMNTKVRSPTPFHYWPRISAVHVSVAVSTPLEIFLYSLYSLYVYMYTDCLEILAVGM